MRSRELADDSEALRQRLDQLAVTLRTPEEQAAEIVEVALLLTGASTAVASRLSDDGRTLELVGSARFPTELAAEMQRVDIADGRPICEAVRSGHGVFCGRRADILTHYPAMATLVDRLAIEALCAVPVAYMGRVVGAIGLTFPAPHRFEMAERGQLRALALRLARALHQARLYLAQRDARAEAERARTEAESARREADVLRERAEDATRAKAAFLAVVSHELRSPLNAILGYASLLGDGIAGPLTPQQAAFLGRLRASGRQLAELVEELLAAARGDAGQDTLTVRTCPVSELLAQVSAVAQPLATGKAIVFRCTAPPEVERATLTTDTSKLRQVVVNLVVNAVKFTDRGEVTLDVQSADGDIEFVVRDTGIGIPAAHLERIFDPFWQGSQGSGKALGGTGLGLSIARQYTALLGGVLTVASRAGEGSTFRLRVPMQAPNGI